MKNKRKPPDMLKEYSKVYDFITVWLHTILLIYQKHSYWHIVKYLWKTPSV
jgi:hypothetical protein